MARCAGTGSSAYHNTRQGKAKCLTAKSSPGGKATCWGRGGEQRRAKGAAPNPAPGAELQGPGPKNLLQGIPLLRDLRATEPGR